MCVVLLQEMLKYNTQSDTGVVELEEALESMLAVIKYVNDIMHQVAITGYDVSNFKKLLELVKCAHVETNSMDFGSDIFCINLIWKHITRT